MENECLYFTNTHSRKARERTRRKERKRGRKLGTKESREKQKIAQKRWWRCATSEQRSDRTKKIKTRMNYLYRDPTFRLRQKVACKAYWVSPTNREEQSKRMRKAKPPKPLPSDLQDLYNAGATVREMANKSDHTAYWVYHKLKQLGLPPHKPKNPYALTVEKVDRAIAMFATAARRAEKAKKGTRFGYGGFCRRFGAASIIRNCLKNSYMDMNPKDVYACSPQALEKAMLSRCAELSKKSRTLPAPQDIDELRVFSYLIHYKRDAGIVAPVLNRLSPSYIAEEIMVPVLLVMQYLQKCKEKIANANTRD